jgi:hypothetical protein
MRSKIRSKSTGFHGTKYAFEASANEDWLHTAFLCKARKYEALNGGRTSSGSSALCKMLMEEWARD